MDTETTIAAVSTLADKLGESAETLIGFYTERAPYELMDIVLTAPLAFVGAIGLPFCWRRAKDADYEGEAICFSVGVAISALLALLGFIFTVVETHEAVMALVSPEAYAIDEILDRLSGN